MKTNQLLETNAVELSQAPHAAWPDLHLNPGEEFRLDAAGMPPETVDAWFDALMGLTELDNGSILLDGLSWTKRSNRQQDILRGRIRRVTREGSWISNLDIIENITLSERHHTSRSEAEILQEAEELARRLGMPGLPEGRPAFASRQVLRQSLWVRALLGKPMLMLIDEQDQDLPVDIVKTIVQAVAEKRALGAAVIWIGATNEKGRQ